jgi:hypothetical protein
MPKDKWVRAAAVDALVLEKLAIHRDCCNFLLQHRGVPKNKEDDRLEDLVSMAHCKNIILRKEYMDSFTDETLEEIALNMVYSQSS